MNDPGDRDLTSQDGEVYQNAEVVIYYDDDVQVVDVKGCEYEDESCE